MPCQKCLQKPGYHSFVKFGAVKGCNLFYTAPAKTDDFNEDGTKLASIKLHVSEECSGSPWIWVVDCAEMGLAHYTEFSFNFGLLGLLAADPTLTAIWIVRPNMWMRGVISVLQTVSWAPILTKITYFEGSNVELDTQLAAVGLDSGGRQWLIGQA